MADSRDYKSFLKKDLERRERVLLTETDNLKRLRMMSEITRLRIRIRQNVNMRKAGTMI